MAAPFVYAAIHAVTTELAQHGIDKTHLNEADDYKYRSIDDLLDRLAPSWPSTACVSSQRRSNARSPNAVTRGSTSCVT